MTAKLYTKAKQAILCYLHRTLPACNDITRTLSQSLDRKLSPREGLTLWLHVRLCQGCMRYLRQIVSLRRVMLGTQSNPEVEDSGPKLSTEAIERIKATLDQKGP